MTKTTLFVCQSCQYSAADRPEDQPADGTLLLNRINTLAAEARE